MKQLRKKINYLVSYLWGVALVLMPVVASAQGTLNWKVESFIKVGSIEDLLKAILDIFIVIATPIIVFFIIYAGFLYVTARGNVQQVEQATKALTYAVIGGVIVLGAVAISGIIAGTVTSFSA